MLCGPSMSKELWVHGRQEKVSKSRKGCLVTSSLTDEADDEQVPARADGSRD